MKKLIFGLLMVFAMSSVGMAAESCNCMNSPKATCNGYPNVSKIKDKKIEFIVDTVELSEKGDYVTVFSSKQDLMATIDAAACKDYKEIKQGTKLRMWYKFMTMSLPAKTNASKAKILKQVDVQTLG